MLWTAKVASGRGAATKNGSKVKQRRISLKSRMVLLPLNVYILLNYFPLVRFVKGKNHSNREKYHTSFSLVAVTRPRDLCDELT